MAPIRCVISSNALAGLVGAIGTGFHLYNVTKKVGGFSWQNLFYSAPLGAPAAMSLSGLIGFLAERVRDNEPEGEPEVFGLPAGGRSRNDSDVVARHDGRSRAAPAFSRRVSQSSDATASDDAAGRRRTAWRGDCG